MANKYPMLFTEFDVGPVTLPNRIYHAPVTLNYLDRATGYPTEALAYYYAERARGGVGLIIQGAVDVHPASEYWPVPHSRLYEEGSIPSFTRITNMVHDAGAKIFIELFHVGQASNVRNYGAASLGPSSVPSMVAGTTPKSMELDDIEEVISAFEVTTKNAVAAGYDGIELHASHGYLLEQFLSPYYNRRTDEYGGSLDNRMRMLLETLERCRKIAGEGIAFGVRLVADELLPGGLTLEDTLEISERLADDGMLDFLDIDLGSHQNYHVTMSPMYGAPGYNRPYSAAIRDAVDPLPVLCAPGRLVDPGEAERALAEGQADMVGLGRALISDPLWVQKTQDGREDSIRQCVFCNQYTMGNLYKGLPVGCIQNPVTGREATRGAHSLVSVTQKKKVIVIGGGPAGMEVARLASQRGHDVSLYEKEEELGGQVLLAAMLPGRDAIGGVVRWQKQQLEKAGVETNLGCELLLDQVTDLGADAVIVATGASYMSSGMSAMVPMPMPGSDIPGMVVTPESVLRGECEPGSIVVVLDSDGHVTPSGIAELLASRGHQVTIISAAPVIGDKLVDEMNMPYVYGRLADQNVEMLSNTWAGELRDGEIDIFNVYAPEKLRTLKVNTVVMAAARKTHEGLYHELKLRMDEVHRVGDCISPGDIGTATLSADTLARAL
jgi:2,4-dienoyl-CoA reductase-like NADH-dependent reductase (Old Yellow Enzyme family)